MSTSRYEMPLCFGAFASVRTSSMHQSAIWPSEVHTFWPLTMNSSPLSTARVCKRRQVGAGCGSEKPWHQISSQVRIFLM